MAAASDTRSHAGARTSRHAFGEEQYVQQHGSGAQPWGAYPPCIAAISRRDAHLQVGIVSTLESHWVVLDAELSEIRKDFGALRTVRASRSVTPGSAASRARPACSTKCRRDWQ